MRNEILKIGDQVRIRIRGMDKHKYYNDFVGEISRIYSDTEPIYKYCVELSNGERYNYRKDELIHLSTSNKLLKWLKKEK